MTRDRDFKRLVRARMAKTGESYTAARAHLLGKRDAGLPPDYEKTAGMSDAAVTKATGKGWPEWATTLDEVDAVSMEHREIAAHLRTHHHVSSWWAQMIAVAYERFRGLRDVGQRRGGRYRISKTRTVPVPVSVLWDAFADAGRRAAWLPEVELKVRVLREPESMRLTLSGGAEIEARFTAKGDVKSSVTLEQTDLPDKESVERAKELWGTHLEALRTMLQGS